MWRNKITLSMRVGVMQRGSPKIVRGYIIPISSELDIISSLSWRTEQLVDDFVSMYSTICILY